MPRLIFSLIFLCLSFTVLANSVSQLQQQLSQQHYSRAAEIGVALLKQQPRNDQILFLTAWAYQQNQQPGLALDYYRQLSEHNPDLPEPLNNMALIHLQQGNHDKAVDALIASLKTHPAYATAWQNLSNLYQGLASEAYRKALSEEDKTSQVLDKIQLTALDNLHTLPVTAVAQKPLISQPVQLAKAENPASSSSINGAMDKIIREQQQSSIREQEQQLIQTIRDWANAWSSKDFDAYLGAYTDKFRGRKGSHRAWVEYRRSRILRPGKIEVKLNNIRIKSRSAQRAIIDFEQAFKSPGYRDKVVKRIILSKHNNQWKISQERTLSVL